MQNNINFEQILTSSIHLYVEVNVSTQTTYTNTLYWLNQFPKQSLSFFKFYTILGAFAHEKVWRSQLGSIFF